MSSEEVIEFTAERAGERLDKAILAQIGDRLSRARLQALIAEGQVLVDGSQVKAGSKLKGGEVIALRLPGAPAPDKVQPEDIALDVLYLDQDLAVIDKPAGMIVHPGIQNETGTLLNAALFHWPEIAAMPMEEKRAGIVHRLDKDTSGLIVVARNDLARRRLSAQFQNREVDKHYLALLERRPETSSGRIDAPIARDPKNRKRMAVVRKGKAAISEFTVIDDDFRDGQALVRVHLLTGRTHQIRVHMAFINCPIVGDRVYGYRKQRVRLKRQFLHAASLAFDHPSSGERLQFESPLPAGLLNLLDKLR